MIDKIDIWTDGSYRASVQIGGIGVVVVHDGEVINTFKERYINATNNRMEITAIIQALELITDDIETLNIHTDSQYCLGVINEGWVTTKNLDLWNRFWATEKIAKKYCSTINYLYTKGHHTDKFNNMADKLATEASGYTSSVKKSKEFKESKTMIIALDFDGTVVKHEYPEIGGDIGAVPVLQALQENGHQFILYTMRDTGNDYINYLKEASDWFRKNNINLIGINCNPWQKTWTDSNKVYASLYIDDAALGAPLKKDSADGRPYIDWQKCTVMLAQMGLLTSKQVTALNSNFESK